MHHTRLLSVLSAADVRFLKNVVQRLEAQQLYVYRPGVRRAAAALILRFDDADQREVAKALQNWETRRKADDDARAARRQFEESGEKPSGGPQRLRGLGDLMGTDPSTGTSAATARPSPTLDFITYLEERVGVSEAKPSSLKLLFMKRADRVVSRWSGQIAFPGGQRDPDEDADDLHTVQREVYEELGMPLENEREFVRLGRMRDDRLLSNSLTGFGEARSIALSASSSSETQGVVQAQFVYLHVGDLTPSVRLAHHEVESVQWMPIARLAPAFVSPDSVCHPLSSFVYAADADRRLILSEFFRNAMLAFPSISMPAPPTDASSSSSSSTSASHTPRGSWRVWGQTLRSSSALMMLDDRPAIDWPLFSAKNSTVLQVFVVNALHGYYETCLAAYRVRAAWHYRRWWTRRGPASTSAAAAEARVIYWYGTALQRRHLVVPAGANPLLYAAPEAINAEHVACFFLDIGLALSCAYVVAAVIFTVATAVRIALGWEDDGSGADQRRLDYYASQTPVSAEKLRRTFAARRQSELEAAAQEKKERQEKRERTEGQEPDRTEKSVPTVEATPEQAMDASAAPAVGSEDALAEALAEEKRTAASASRASSAPRPLGTERGQGTPTIVQFGCLHTIYLFAIVRLVWELLKIVTTFDWIGTFETDATLLAGRARPQQRPAAPRASKGNPVVQGNENDGVGVTALVTALLDDALHFLRVERALMRTLRAHFALSVTACVDDVEIRARGGRGADEAGRAIRLVPDPPLRHAEGDEGVRLRAWWPHFVRTTTIVWDTTCTGLAEVCEDLELRERAARVQRELSTVARRLTHSGQCTNDALLARAWLYQNRDQNRDHYDADGRAIGRQDWHPLGIPARRSEEAAVEAERRALASAARFLATHPTWLGATTASEKLRQLLACEPTFNVWVWAKERSENSSRRKMESQRLAKARDLFRSFVPDVYLEY